MFFYADLHIHSKYSRATSKSCNLEELAIWAQKKGLSVISTGDFTHPAWFAEIKEKLVPAGPGVFKLRDDIEKKILKDNYIVRFLLSVEISTIYKKGEKTRKVHHVVFVPDFKSAENLRQKLSAVGNIVSDGRPILGLDSRNLLEITLESGEGSYIVPAHIWTPWFSVLGSKSGFDSVSDCYADLADHIFAVETGLSSDPEMNWRVSSLDKYRLISNSDAHSPSKLAREATVFDTEPDYFSLMKALQTGKGYVGTVEFFPEEGKYHEDGHRKCNVCLSPEETVKLKGICPVCSKPLTIGVLNRVNELADRKGKDLIIPKTAGKVFSLVPLQEILSEIMQVGVASNSLNNAYESLIQKLGPELSILREIPIDEISKKHSSLLGEAISRLRQGKVIRHAGFDGEYGIIKLFEQE
ncbi:MAG: endonuclease Q family protein, partial [Endomicrobia bacterium]|nr:endonuclease Q family protein [Endomicrobiia bacterium]